MALSLHHVSRCDQLWAMGDVVDVTTSGCISGKGVPLSVGLRGIIMATHILCYVLEIQMIVAMILEIDRWWIRVKFHGQPAMCFARC